MPTSSPSILLTGAATGSIVVENLSRPGVDLPPSNVGNRDPLGNNDRADIIVAGAKAVSIEDLESFCSTIGFESTEILMHIQPIGECTLQGESNCVCSYKARRRVDNDRVKNVFSTVYVTLMSGSEVGLDRREGLEHPHVVVVSIHLGVLWQEPVFEGIRMKLITRGRIIRSRSFYSSKYTSFRKEIDRDKKFLSGSYALLMGDMRNLKVPRRRKRSPQFSKGKRLTYLSTVGGRRATLHISLSKSW